MDSALSLGAIGRVLKAACSWLRREMRDLEESVDSEEHVRDMANSSSMTKGSLIVSVATDVAFSTIAPVWLNDRDGSVAGIEMPIEDAGGSNVGAESSVFDSDFSMDSDICELTFNIANGP